MHKDCMSKCSSKCHDKNESYVNPSMCPYPVYYVDFSDIQIFNLLKCNIGKVVGLKLENSDCILRLRICNVNPLSVMGKTCSGKGPILVKLSSIQYIDFGQEIYVNPLCYSGGGSNIPGPMGPQGPKGDKGAKGDKGDVGPMGPQGPKGNKGDMGPMGPQGPKGDKGDAGSMGSQGPKGDKGDTGSMGPKGPKGDKGDTGSMGPQGPKGDKGNTGSMGPKGDKGDKGDQGDKYVHPQPKKVLYKK